MEIAETKTFMLRREYSLKQGQTISFYNNTDFEVVVTFEMTEFGSAPNPFNDDPTFSFPIATNHASGEHRAVNPGKWVLIATPKPSSTNEQMHTNSFFLLVQEDAPESGEIFIRKHQQIQFQDLLVFDNNTDEEMTITFQPSGKTKKNKRGPFGKGNLPSPLKNKGKTAPEKPKDYGTWYVIGLPTRGEIDQPTSDELEVTDGGNVPHPLLRLFHKIWQVILLAFPWFKRK
ncbi:MAG: hypothetical protein QNK37_00460 [Acidobacteriota bacterium]|nr:hypothetical protein [Acidobacteriota bacterium]